MSRLEKIYADTDFSNSVVPSGSLLSFIGQDGTSLVSRYKDSSGNFGSLSGGGGGGTGGETTYYKCATVDTTNQTWTGYKAVLTNGIYSFETTTTTGLTYTSKIPVVGNVYDSTALVTAILYTGDIVQDSILFYAKLAEASSIANSGQALTTDSSVQYLTFKGIPCALFSGSGGILSSLSFSGTTDRSMAIWTYSTANTSKWLTALLHGGTSNNSNFGLYKGNTNYLAWSTSGTAAYSQVSALNTWHSFIATYQSSSGELKLYVDGVLSDSSIQSFNVSADYIKIGTDWVGYLASARIYGKVLSSSEIIELATEFSPTN